MHGARNRNGACVLRYLNTTAAAKSEKRSSWDLISAIAIDATENGVLVGSLESRVAAKDAMDGEGLEYKDSTIKHLCVLSQFDYDSSATQRRVWRRYGWSAVYILANAGWSQEAAAKFLDVEKRRTFREAQAAASRKVAPNAKPSASACTPGQLDRAWADWANKLTSLMLRGAELAEASEQHEGVEWSGHAAIAQMVYGRIVERQLDAEIRDLLESEMTA